MNQPTNRLFHYLLLLGVLAVFLVLGLRISLNASQGPDETAHYYFNRFVAAHGRLPLTDAERLEAGYKADLPPLYYLIAGTLGRAVDLESPPHLKITRDNPRLQLLTGIENIKGWRLIPTEDPLRGELLLWYLGRWTALAFGLLGLLAVYGFLRLTQPGQPWLALGGTAVLAFLSTYTYVSSVTSYESLTGVLMTGYFILLFLAVTRQASHWLFLGLGLLLGLAGAARQTPWPLLPILPLVVLGLAWFQRWTRRDTLIRLGLVVLGLSLTFGLWLLYLAVYFNRAAELGWFQGFISPLLIGDGSGKTSLQIAGLMSNGQMGTTDLSRQGDPLWLWAWTFFSGVWGSGWLGWLLAWLWGVAVVGGVRRWRHTDRPDRLWLVLLVIHIAMLMFFPLLRFIFSGEARTAMSQHILFPGGAALLALLLWGWRGWLKPKYVAWLLLGLAAIYLSRDAAAAFSHHNPPFPVRTVPFAAEGDPVADFGALVLFDYDIVADSRVLTATLFWRAEESPAEDYRFALTLLDADGQPQARRLEQPVNGRYPTRAWLPGDRLRQTIYLPLVGLPPGDYTPQLQLWGEQSPHGEPVTLPPVSLAPAAAVSTGALTVAGQRVDYAFWDEGQPVDSPPRYGEGAAATVTVNAWPTDEFRLTLVGPDGQSWPPIDRTGHTLTFAVSPKFTDGDYRLRLAQWQGDTVTASLDSPPLFTAETQPRQFDVPPVAVPVNANFAGYVSLLGYDLPQAQVQPGAALPLTVYWQARRTIGANLIIFNTLIGPDGQQWGGQERLAQDVYSTFFWAADEVVPDAYTIPVAADAPPGVYYLLVGLYLPVGESSVSLPLVRAGNGAMSEVTHVTIGPIEISQPGSE